MTFKYIIYKYRLKFIFTFLGLLLLGIAGIELWNAQRSHSRVLTLKRRSTPSQKPLTSSDTSISPDSTPSVIPYKSESSFSATKWEWKYERDADYRGLTKEQCQIAFPNNTYQIEDAVERLGGRKITEYDLGVADGRLCVRVMIYNQEAGGLQDDSYMAWRWEERIIGTLALIYDAVATAQPGTIPNSVFAWCSDDDTLRAHRRTVMGYNRHYAWEDQRDIWVIPDFGYWTWQKAMAESYRDLRRRLHHISDHMKWSDKIPQILWRGDPHVNKIRRDLMAITEDKAWANVGPCQQDECHVSMPNHCKFMFLAHTEGITYSGRLKFLQNCKSLIIAHQLNWIEHHTHLLKPDGPEQNYVLVERDWSDLEEKISYYTDHPEEAEAIAERSYNLFAKRYHTPAAIACYFRSLLNTWAEHQDFEPQLYRNGTDGKMELNGVPYELYIVGRNFIFEGSEDGRSIKHRS
ncbi:MAG: hypothetical protein Q9157_002436 [Trypethelium eluteriae]